MFHPNTQRLMDYWTARAASGEAPPRSAIDPGDFRQLLSQVFILGRDERGLYPIRLAGGLLGQLHGRDLRSVNGLALWAEHDRGRLQSALEEIRRRPEPLVAWAEAAGERRGVSLEVLFAPLAAPEGGTERFLGLYQPLSPFRPAPAGSGAQLSLRALSRPGAPEETAPRLRLAAAYGRRVA